MSLKTDENSMFIFYVNFDNFCFFHNYVYKLLFFARLLSYLSGKSKFKEMKSYIISAIILAVLASCQSNSNKKNTDKPVSIKVDSIPKTTKNEPVNEELNLIASFLSGNEPKNSGDFSTAFNTSEWKKHQSFINKAWGDVLLKCINPIHEWSKAEKIERKSETLFYPFSGADFLYVYSAHPDYTSYYLFGLEPTGEIPKKENIINPTLTPNILNAVCKSVDENMTHSFFITKFMAKEFSNPVLKGTIPIFMFFMNRMGVELTSISPVAFNDDGKIIDATNFSVGVRFRFLDKGILKELYYFSQDISDGGLKKTPGLSKMLNLVSKDATTMIKSASYVCHEAKFSGITNIIISNSFSIMQDDTGVPFRYFDASKWKIRHYGKYTKPIPIFANAIQEDLKKAIIGKELPLPFRYGYNNPANLMISTRKQ